MLRDKLLARLAEMGDAPDHQRLAADVLGIRGAPPELARRLVAQAVELDAAALDGRWTIQRTRRNGADLHVHAQRVMKFFRSARRMTALSRSAPSHLAPRTDRFLMAGRPRRRDDAS